jgi:hypothetical protein
MKFLDKINSLSQETLSRFHWAIQISSSKILVGQDLPPEIDFIKEELEDGTVREDTTDLIPIYQDIQKDFYEEFMDEGDNTGFPKAQKFWKDNNISDKYNIGNMIAHFILLAYQKK